MSAAAWGTPTVAAMKAAATAAPAILAGHRLRPPVPEPVLGEQAGAPPGRLSLLVIRRSLLAARPARLRG
ncbi:hypothetical protein SBRY_100140 [Actinacidiphila bryophytorum]|uniref:Uncharacterized protein n=1 Tax=Actinacidiphila bryophytorum TaxID=1436133 RepID=A0A9W4GY72_9ACTN|nr:hypothetical protein SBRY_100140 [Actinacidiphila bryophytorum]